MFLLLQPTTPLRKTETLSKALELFFEKEANSVVTVSRVPAKFNAYEGNTIKDSLFKPSSSKTGIIRKNQGTLPLYMRDGQVYVSRASLVKQGRLLGESYISLVQKEEFIVNIDNRSDLVVGEFLVDKGYLEL